LKKLLWLPFILAPLGGCSIFFDEETEHSISRLAGFASDTTAIIYKYNWVTSKNLCGPGNAGSCASSKDYIDLELKLVDVRFKKIYWMSRVKNDCGDCSWTRQWNDSTILISDMLWKIGDSKPQKINFKWNTEEIYFYGHWLPWENDSILAPTISGSYLIIDTKNKTVNSRETPACSDWWSKDMGRGCFMVNKDSCSFSLLSENGDTLSSFTFADGCNSEEFDIHTGRYFIEASLRYSNDVYFNAYIKYDDKGNIAQVPSFWVRYGTRDRDIGIWFEDSLNNIVRYD
jgi:hypothetical protein